MPGVRGNKARKGTNNSYRSVTPPRREADLIADSRRHLRPNAAQPEKKETER